MSDDIFIVLRKKIRNQMNELADMVATGGVPDWSAYCRVVGKIEGLAFAEAYILDLEKRHQEDA